MGWILALRLLVFFRLLLHPKENCGCLILHALVAFVLLAPVFLGKTSFYVCAGDFRIYRRFARMRGKYRRGEAAKNRYSLYWRSPFIFGRRFVSKGNALRLLRPKICLPLCLFRRVDFNGDFIRLLFCLQLLASFVAFKRFQRLGA